MTRKHFLGLARSFVLAIVLASSLTLLGPVSDVKAASVATFLDPGLDAAVGTTVNERSGAICQSDYRIPPLPLDSKLQSPLQSAGGAAMTNCEYMIGDVAVTVIFPESDGAIDPSTENWDTSRMSTCISEITAGLTWWENLEPRANLNFSIYTYHELTSYEPISGTSWLGDESLWIDEILAGLGYTAGSYSDKVGDLNNAQRSHHKTDWAYTIFVADSYNDPDGLFADGLNGRAGFGGPYVMMTYDNGSYGIDNMDRVAAHETGHIFFATDEYNGKSESGGYLNIQEDEDALDCMMNYRLDWNLCPSSRGQVGWRDSDGDDILDPVDTVPDTTLDPYSPNPTSNNILVYTGTVQDIPLTSTNPWTWSNSVTINTITIVQYRADYGWWFGAGSADGTFDEVTETFSFATPPLSPGTHVIETRAQNSVTNWETSYAVDIVDVDMTQVDTTNPVLTLNDIPDSVNSLPSIGGTAADTSPGQVSKVQIQINNTTDGTYWDGNSWAQGESGLDVNGTTSWSYSMPSLTNGKSYEVKAKAIDNAGNESPTASDSFTFDTVAPSVTLTSTVISPTKVSPIPMTATFSENVTGFAEGGISVGNGTASNFAAVSTTVYTFDVTPSGQGAVTVDVAAEVAHDAASNGNEAATQYSIGYAAATGDQPPNQPTNTSPANRAASTYMTITLRSSVFSDPDDEDTHQASQWQITATVGSYSNPVFDSGTDASHLTSIAVPSGKLSYSTSYCWHVRYQDNHGVWSDWSTETLFTTLAQDTDGGDGDGNGSDGDGNGSDGEVGGCCSASSVDASVGDTAIAWGTLGLCSGTAYFFVRRIGRRKK